MNKSIITQTTIDDVLRFLEMEVGFNSASISYEIQEDGNYILISVVINDFTESNVKSSFKNIGNALNILIPGRKGEHSWMIVFKKNDEIIDSYFGGDLDCPYAGL